ncbi:MAG: D-tyrosyl-tRNA(Tyr) deacylase [Bacilli bacterium]|nr:D-tyrosyl-tRNA(Tyr) deacylase [Bacilli bacterium]
MRVVVQRSLEASCTVEKKIIGKIPKGLVLLVGFTKGDTEEKIDWMVHKVLNLRIFEDENGVMNQSVLEVGGEILSISQFTLYGDVKKGNRPSYIEALGGEEAGKLYQLWNEKLAKAIPVATGKFGADMKIKLINDGPVTILLER